MNKLFKDLKASNRFGLVMLMAFSNIIPLALVGFRILFSNEVTFLFLVWNLFLAFLPLAISTYIVLRQERMRSKIFFFGLIFAWLLFLPNAPYIITDFIHLKHRDFPYWYDLVMILFFAWNGLLMGFLSLMDIQHLMTKRYGKITGWLFSFLALGLCSFGIYLGRFLRWNSWDIVTHPYGLASDIWVRVANPADHLRTVGVTLMFTVFLSISYAMLQILIARNPNGEPGN